MAQPTGRERIQAVLEGKLIDRAPAMVWRHFPMDDQSGVELGRSAVSFQQEYDWDVVKVTPAQTSFPEVWGGSSTFAGDPLGTRQFVRRAVTSLADWDRIRATQPDTAPLEAQIKAVRYIRDVLGADVVIVGTVFSPLSILRYLAGDEIFLATLRLAPDQATSVLEVITGLVEAATAELMSVGCDGIFLSLFPAGASFLSEDEYLRFGTPGDRAVLAACDHALLRIVHLHASYPWLQLVREYPCEAVSYDAWPGAPDLLSARQVVGAKVLVGGIDQRTWLQTGSAGEVQVNVRRALDYGANHLILAPGCSLSQVVPWGSLRAVRAELAVSGGAR